MSGHCRITPDGSPGGLVSELAGDLAPVIGRIETLVGACTVSRSGATPAQLSVGDLVGPSDVIETSAGGRLSILFADGTTFTLSDNARMAVKDYVDDAAPTLFDISRGTFSFIAGKMAEAGRLCIQTPFASIRARRNGGGMGMLSLVSLFFAAFEEAQAGPSDISFLDDGNITSKDLGQFGIVELRVHATATQPEFVKLMDDPGETIVIRSSGSSFSVDTVTNSIAQMALIPGRTTGSASHFLGGLAARTRSDRQRGRGIEFTSAARIYSRRRNRSISFRATIRRLSPPPPGPGTTQQNTVSDPPLVLPPPPPPGPPSPAGASFHELDGHTGSSQSDDTNVSLAFSLVSQDPPTFAWSTGQPLPAVALNLLVAPPQPGEPDPRPILKFTGPNPTDFQFSVQDQRLDFLAQNETLTVTYNVTVTDGLGHDLPQQVVITLTGSNDPPTITVGAGDHDSGAVKEDTNPDVSNNLKSDGTLSFSDVDLTDTHSVTNVTASAGALGTLTADVTTDDTNGIGGVITWHYTVADDAVDYLAEGQTKVETFTISLFDGTSTVTKDVTVTITGSNEDALIAVGAGDHDTGAVKEDTNPDVSNNLKSDGTLSFSDVDLTDTHSVTNVTASAGALGTLTASVTTDDTNGTGGVITWHYTVADDAVDYLAEGQTKVETFTISLFDGTSTVTKDVTVTITGTQRGANDRPRADCHRSADSRPTAARHRRFGGARGRAGDERRRALGRVLQRRTKSRR